MNKNQQYRIIITPGEPAGIGPDIVVMIAQKKWPIELVVCADPNLLLERAKKINLPLKLNLYHSKKTPSPCSIGELSLLPIPLLKNAIPGYLDAMNNNYVINTLKKATQGCINKEFLALITGPVHKAILNTKKITFFGHTEFLSKLCQSSDKKPVMMLSNTTLRIALATTHIPISSVAQNITYTHLYNTISTLIIGLQKYFYIPRPKIYICGLNPHSGESGYLGTEEIEIITPIINTFNKNKNCKLIGPLSADTIFQPKYLSNADVILAMYHDQGLPVLKYSGFHQAVNITFGLPFIRTSVSHGTALTLSGTGTAQCNSMQQAIITAINMINNSHKNVL